MTNAQLEETIVEMHNWWYDHWKTHGDIPLWLEMEQFEAMVDHMHNRFEKFNLL